MPSTEAPAKYNQLVRHIATLASFRDTNARPQGRHGGGAASLSLTQLVLARATIAAICLAAVVATATVLGAPGTRLQQVNVHTAMLMRRVTSFPMVR